MAEFINTIDSLGGEAVIDSIIMRTITEFKDDSIKTVGVRDFAECKALTNVELLACEEIEARAFDNCTALTSVNLPKLTELGTNAFYRSRIEKIILPSLTTLYQYWHFGSNPSLTYADFSVLTVISGHCFHGCTALTTLVLRGTTLTSLISTDALTDTPISSGGGYIYVPRALVDSYKAAINWSTYADQIRALEDYTVDGTITGELDETKI